MDTGLIKKHIQPNKITRGSYQPTTSIWNLTLKHDQKSQERNGLLMYNLHNGNICPELRLLTTQQSKEEYSSKGLICQIYSTTSEDCELSQKMHISKEILKCAAHPNKKPICELTESGEDFHENQRRGLIHSCNIEICANAPVSIGSIDPRYGVFQEISKWPKFYKKQDLEKYIQSTIKKSIRNGFNFILLHCFPENSTISLEQVLMFSHRSPIKNTKQLKTNININFLVLDSLSRPHFYRMLSKTVSELSKIKEQKINNVEVLDFKMVQSVSPYTIHNIRGLMSGDIDQENSEKTSYKFQKLFKLFKEYGYFTLLQEDACWYDTWGTMFDGSKRKRKRLSQKMNTVGRYWKRFNEDIKNSFIDDYGMSHFSCEVFKKYGKRRSNQYGDKLPSVCFNNKPLSWYFLEYVKKRFVGPNGEKQFPFLSYTHLNVAHEHSGVRIKDSDEAIAAFLSTIAKLENTWTVILSDHGAKASSYSHTKPGRFETYHPLLFMLIPNKFSQFLGEDRMRFLRENQGRLVTFVDLHHMIMSLFPSEILNSKQQPVSLLTPISLNRTCDDIPHVSYALCICKNSDKEYPDNSSIFTRIADFAVTQLNNMIDKQFAWLKKKYLRKCSGLHLDTFTGIRRSELKNGISSTIMHVNVNSRTPPEVFEVQVNENGQKLKLESWRRISIYQGYERCRDKTVDVKLCIC